MHVNTNPADREY